MTKRNTKIRKAVQGTNVNTTNLAYKEEFLQYLEEQCNVDVTDELGKFEMLKRQEILKAHKNSVWYSEKEDAWYTHLPDETQKNHRRKVKRKHKEDLENAICAYYRTQDSRENITVAMLYAEWMQYKNLHVNSSGTMKRISADWNKFYRDDEISSKKVQELTELYLDEWIHKKIKKYHFNKKQYYNMSLPIRQMMDFASRRKYIKEDVFKDVKVEAKLLSKPVKKADGTQVFLVNEIPSVFEELDRHYQKYPKNTAPLAVELAFYTGLRVGELVAIRYQDIDLDNGYLHVCCQEVKEFSQMDNGDYKFSHLEVTDHTKSDAGDRYVYLVPEAIKIIKRIKEANENNVEVSGDFLFVKNGERIKARAVVYQLDRCLNAVSITHKSIHKVRKTYVSALIDGGININEIRKQVGHADVRTTYECYCYNRYGEQETSQQIGNALDFNLEKKRRNSVKEQVVEEVTMSDQKIIPFREIKNRDILSK